MNPSAPLTEAELHAWVDGQLAAERAREVEAYLAAHPDEAARVEAWRTHKHGLRSLFDPVQDEPLPARLVRAAQPPVPSGWPAQARRLAAGLALALLGGGLGWSLRGVSGTTGSQLAQGGVPGSLPGFAQRAALAHAVYSPDARRAVEVDAAHEDQLVTWLSKRMGSPMQPPHLQAVGYELEGGRLLPGGQGPVAQFMYRRSEAGGGRLTLYVSDEAGTAGEPADAAFRFGRQGELTVFYWVDGRFGYALSAEAGRDVLAQVAAEVYRQIGRRR